MQILLLLKFFHVNIDVHPNSFTTLRKTEGYKAQPKNSLRSLLHARCTPDVIGKLQQRHSNVLQSRQVEKCVFQSMLCCVHLWSVANRLRFASLPFAVPPPLGAGNEAAHGDCRGALWTTAVNLFSGSRCLPDSR